MNTLIFISDGWGPKYGGINSFNYSLCIAMSKIRYDNFKVICLSTDVSENEKGNVYEKYGLILCNLATDDLANIDGIVKKLIYEKLIDTNEDTILWVGHDIKTGFIAIKCRDKIFGSKCAIIHHMSYKDYYVKMNSNTDKVNQKIKQQEDVLLNADFVLANGPVLKESAEDILRVSANPKILEIISGLAQIQPIEKEPKSFDAITFGRIETVNNSNGIIKQAKLAVAAWSNVCCDRNLRCSSSHMYVVGYDKQADIQEAEKELKEHSQKYSKKALAVHAQKYTDNQEEIFNLLKKQSISMMLSVNEGFGLAGYEAISAAVPVIISKNSGLYKMLKQNNLEGYVLGVDINGSYDEMDDGFTEEDLRCVTDALKDYCYEPESWKKKALKLRKELLDLNFTWENCAKSVMDFCFNDLKHLTKNKKNTQINDSYTNRLLCLNNKVISTEPNWVNRYNQFNQLDSALHKKRIVLLEGGIYSGKVIVALSWLKNKNISKRNILFFQTIEKETSDQLEIELDDYIKKKSDNEDVYLLINQFDSINLKSFIYFINIYLDKYSFLNIILFSEKKLKNLLKIKEELGFFDVIQINGFQKEEANKFFQNYNITLKEEQLEKLSKHELLPGILKNCIELYEDGYRIDTALNECFEGNQIENKLRKVFYKLDKNDIKLANVYALFDAPFSKNIAEIFANKYNKNGISSMGKLIRNLILKEYSEFSYYIPTYIRKNIIKSDYLGDEKQEIYKKIASYYLNNYLHECSYDMEKRFVISGIEACRYEQLAMRFNNAWTIFKMKPNPKLSVKKQSMKNGLYNLIIPIMEEQMNSKKCNDKWLIYNLLHCYVITGDFDKAKKIVFDDILINIEGEDLRNAIVRIKAELFYEIYSNKKASEYLDDYLKEENFIITDTTQIQLKFLKIELLISENKIEDAKKLCNMLISTIEKENVKNDRMVYTLAISRTYLLILNLHLVDETYLEEVKNIEHLYKELNDLRGMAWIIGIKGEIYLKIGNRELGMQCLWESISKRREFDECSKSYRGWIEKILDYDIDDNVELLVIKEIERFRRKLNKHYISQKLLAKLNENKEIIEK